MGMSRLLSSEFTCRVSDTNNTITQTSASPLPSYSAPDPFPSVTVFARNTEINSRNAFASARLAFYSIGESLDLALLDARVTALITAFGVAIP
jgi:hypothetical protein